MCSDGTTTSGGSSSANGSTRSECVRIHTASTAGGRPPPPLACTRWACGGSLWAEAAPKLGWPGCRLACPGGVTRMVQESYIKAKDKNWLKKDRKDLKRTSQSWIICPARCCFLPLGLPNATGNNLLLMETHSVALQHITKNEEKNLISSFHKTLAKFTAGLENRACALSLLI